MRHKSFLHRISFQMWLGITVLAVCIAGVFWLILEASLRMNYERENTEHVDRLLWAGLEKYGDPDFSESLRLLADSDDCYIQLIRETDLALISSYDPDGAVSTDTSSEAQAEGIIPDDLLTRLDKGGGICSYTVTENGRNLSWNVKAAVVAFDGTDRYILILSKALTNMTYLLLVFRNRVLFSLAGVLAAASLMAFLFTRYFAGPINRLTKRARKMAEGDYQTDFPGKGPEEIRALSDTLKLAAEEFDATEKLRRDFIANITHDMKTPLTVIRMYAEMIESVSGNDPVRRKEHLDKITDEVDRLNDFISDTIDLSRLQSGTWELKMEVFSLNHLIESGILRYSGQCDAKGNPRIIVDMESDLYVEGDRKLIWRVIDNYISNAIKFSPESEPIFIDAKRESENRRIRVSVTDRGAGIPEDKLDAVWDRYYHVDPFGRDKTGTGLGLNIVREIMRLHNEPYGVSSKPQKGSVFWFCLKEGTPS